MKKLQQRYCKEVNMNVLNKKGNSVERRIELQTVERKVACALSKPVEAQRDQSFGDLSGMSHI